MPETPQQRLWKLDSYRALDDTRRRLATGILLEGLSFSAACRLLKLNQTREAKRLDVQRCLADFRAAIPSVVPVEHVQADRRKGLGFADAEEEAVWAMHLVIDRLDGDTTTGEKVPSDEALYAAESVVLESVAGERTVQRVGLDVRRIAEFEAILRQRTAPREQPPKPIKVTCDGCQGALAGIGTTRGIHTVCASCLEEWNRTGQIPGRALTRASAVPEFAR